MRTVLPAAADRGCGRCYRRLRTVDADGATGGCGPWMRTVLPAAADGGYGRCYRRQRTVDTDGATGGCGRRYRRRPRTVPSEWLLTTIKTERQNSS